LMNIVAAFQAEFLKLARKFAPGYIGADLSH